MSQSTITTTTTNSSSISDNKARMECGSKPKTDGENCNNTLATMHTSAAAATSSTMTCSAGGSTTKKKKKNKHKKSKSKHGSSHKKEFTAVKESMETPVGIQLVEANDDDDKNGKIYIASIQVGGLFACRIGLVAGMRLVKVNNMTVAHMPIADIYLIMESVIGELTLLVAPPPKGPPKANKVVEVCCFSTTTTTTADASCAGCPVATSHDNTISHYYASQATFTSSVQGAYYSPLPPVDGVYETLSSSSPPHHGSTCDDLPLDIDFKDQYLTVNELRNGERHCSTSHPASSMTTSTTTTTTTHNDCSHNGNHQQLQEQICDPPSDIGYKDQALTLNELHHGRRVRVPERVGQVQGNHSYDHFVHASFFPITEASLVMSNDGNSGVTTVPWNNTTDNNNNDDDNDNNEHAESQIHLSKLW